MLIEDIIAWKKVLKFKLMPEYLNNNSKIFTPHVTRLNIPKLFQPCFSLERQTSNYEILKPTLIEFNHINEICSSYIS